MLKLQPVAAADGRQVIIHPGVVRTATSTLQKHVFAQHPGLYFLGLPARTPELEWAVRHVCEADTMHLIAERLQRAFETGCAGAPAGKPILISYENYTLYKSKDKGLVAERLKNLFPHAKIVFTLRAQESLIVSRYFNDLRRRIKLKSFITFEDWYWFERRESYRTIFDDLRYFPVVEYYAGLFGRQNIRLILFEEIKIDRKAFATRFAEALQVDAAEFERLLGGKRENATMSSRYYQFWRWFGHFLPRRYVRDLATRFPDRHHGRPARLTLPAEIRADLVALCAEDNGNLMKHYHLDLQRYGYSVPRKAMPLSIPERTKGSAPCSPVGAFLGHGPLR